MVTPPPLRIVFFGTPAFAVPTLSALIDSAHAVVGVICKPDRPRGRGQQLSAGPVKAHALANGLPVLQPEKMRDEAFIAALRDWRPALGVVAAYGRILTDALLAIPRLGMVNVHASLLPRWRGAAPVHRAILAGDRETGVTIMRVVHELDAGPMLAVARRPIGADETSEQVERALSTLGARLLVETVDALAQGTAAEQPQPAEGITYAERLTRDDAPIEWTRPARAVHDQVRGLHPWPLASTRLNGQRLIVVRTSIETAQVAPTPGTVLEASGDRLVVGTGDGALRLLEVKPEGRRAMTARDFLAGHRLSPGARLE